MRAAPPPRAIPDTYTVRRGDTMHRIASANAQPGTTLDQMLVALFRTNPQAFVADIAPNTIDQPIPSLLVHTLLENALKHGLYGSVEQESIFLQTKLSDKHLIIKMENTFDPTTPTPKGSGTGLKNIRERLALLYSEGTLIEQKNDHKLFSITLYLPLES